MTALTIKNIPDDLYMELKRAAELHHRSINSEVIVCLQERLLIKRLTTDERLQGIRQLRAQIPAGVIEPEDIEDAINEGRP